MPRLNPDRAAVSADQPWQEGARAALTHGNFSMTPYGPSPRAYERSHYPNARTRAAAAWADGFWYARRDAAHAQVLLEQAQGGTA